MTMKQPALMLYPECTSLENLEVCNNPLGSTALNIRVKEVCLVY